MSNQREIDYEKQFNDDLAKATALSLEQQALDEYNRSKKYRSYYDKTARQNSASVTEEHSYSDRSQLYATVNKTAATVTATGSNVLDNDLINFNSPTAQKPNEQQTFETLINDLQKLQTQTSLVPMPTAAPIPTPRTNAAANYGAANMQLEVFTAPQKMPLTNENLQQLYNMPYMQHYGGPARPAAPVYPMGFMPPPAAVSAAYMSPHAVRYPQYAPYGVNIPYHHSSSYSAITPPSATANGAAPHFPQVHLHSKAGRVGSPNTTTTPNNITSTSTTDGRALSRLSSVDTNVIRRPSRGATGDDLIDLNQFDEYVFKK